MGIENMDNKRSSNFRINIDERPDSVLKSRKGAQTEKINRRTTIVFAALFMILGAVFILGYIDISKKLSGVQGTGSSEVKDLTTKLDSRFAEMNDKYAKINETIDTMEKSMNKKVLPMDEIFLTLEKNTNHLKTNLAKAEKSIKQVISSKTGKKEFKNTIAKLDAGTKKLKAENGKLKARTDKLEKTIEPLPKDLADIESGIQSLDGKITNELAALNKAVKSAQKEMEKIRSDIEMVSSGKIYKQVISISLKRQKRELRKSINALTKALEDNGEQIKSVRRRVNRLEKSLKSSKKPVSSGKPGNGTLKPGDYTEQDIQ